MTEQRYKELTAAVKESGIALPMQKELQKLIDKEFNKGTEETKKESVSYTITEDTHTQTGAKIWIVKPEKELNKTDFAEVKRKLATIQGYYSTFKHGFIFKYNPTEALQTG